MRVTLLDFVMLSAKERKARVLTFDPKITLLTGPNGSGKSCVLKSLVEALGARPQRTDHSWSKLNLTTLVRFERADETFAVYHEAGTYSVFRDKIHIRWCSNIDHLGRTLAELLGFHLMVTKRGQQPVPAPVDFSLVPYYVDQDTGWTTFWGSLELPPKFDNWPRDAIEYCAGLREPSFYEWRSKAHATRESRRNLVQEVEALEQQRTRLKTELADIGFDMDIGTYFKQVNDLMKDCKRLKKKQDDYRQTISELETQQIRLKAQLQVVERAEQENHRDFEFANEQPLGVDCPTCGAHYDNSFKERFSIAVDAWTCRSLADEIKQELSEIRRKLAARRNKLTGTKALQKRIRQTLAVKKRGITFDDVVGLRAKKDLLTTLSDQIETLSKAVQDADSTLSDIKAEIDLLDDEDLRTVVLDTYVGGVTRNLGELRVASQVDLKELNKLAGKVNATGSALPRAILGKSFAMLRAFQASSSNQPLAWPLIIDSPRQQEQDEENQERVLSFITTQRPGTQLVLATTAWPEALPTVDREVRLTKSGALVADHLERATVMLAHYRKEHATERLKIDFNHPET